MAGHVLADCMYNILNFYLSVLFHCDYFCDTLHAYNCLYSIQCFVEPPPYLLRDAFHKFPWNVTENTPYFTVIPPHIFLLSFIDFVNIKQKEIAKQMVDILKLELDESNTNDVTTL